MTQSVEDSLTTDRLNSLSPQLRKAARFVVEHPDQVAMRSQRHVARTAQLSPPTFTRLAHAIGFDSYDDLRDQCRNEFIQQRTFLSQKAEAMVANSKDLPGGAGFFNEHALASVQNVQDLMQNLDHDTLEGAAEDLAAARSVSLIGVMSARTILEYVTYIANMSLGGWSFLGRDGDGAARILTELGPNDVALSFSIAPYAASSVSMSEVLAKRDVTQIVVTDNRLSPLVPNAKHCFYLATSGSQFFPSHGAAIVFFEALIGMVIRKRGSESQKRIAAIEQQNHELDRYWRDKRTRKKGD